VGRSSNPIKLDLVVVVVGRQWREADSGLGIATQRQRTLSIWPQTGPG
jgi:hypothetical protein